MMVCREWFHEWSTLYIHNTHNHKHHTHTHTQNSHSLQQQSAICSIDSVGRKIVYSFGFLPLKFILSFSYLVFLYIYLWISGGLSKQNLLRPISSALSTKSPTKIKILLKIDIEMHWWIRYSNNKDQRWSFAKNRHSSVPIHSYI